MKTGDQPKVPLAYGTQRLRDRVYRYLHMDTGHLGQRMNLAATPLGLEVSGIAGFFDNQVNQVLGIPMDQAVIHITTLGDAELLSFEGCWV